MIQPILKSDFTQMPWKNGRGVTTEIFIYPPGATLEKNNFLYRLSSAPVEQDGDFSLFSKKRRILTPIKGTGFKLNSEVYEKFEVAQFSGDDRIHCSLLKGPILDFGIIYDPERIKAQVRILHLKTDMSFSLDRERDYFFTVLEGELSHNGQLLKDLESLHYHQESSCYLQVKKSVVLFYLTLKIPNE